MSEVKFDPVAELMECLTVLMEYAENSEDSLDHMTEEELVTASWQTVQLVQSLLAEHQQLVTLMNNVMAERQAAVVQAQQAKAATGLVIANAGQARQYIREAGL